MTLPYIIANLPTGNNPGADLDTNFNAVAAMAVLQCSATGTNAITLSQNSGQPAVTSYTNYLLVSFVAAAQSSSSVTANLNGIGSINVYRVDGSPANAGDFIASGFYIMAYNSGLNSGTGGFQIVSTGTARQLPGTTTNDTANAGNLGELITSTVGPVSLTTGVALGLTSITLTAGDWDVSATIGFTANPATTATGFEGGISLINNSLPTPPATGAYFAITSAVGAGGIMPVLPTGTTRILLAATTLVYLIALANFSVNSMTGYGFIRARRAR